MQLLQDWLNLPDLKLDQIWYMEAHGANYFKEHCKAMAQGREVDVDKLLDANGVDMCYKEPWSYKKPNEIPLGGNKTGVIQREL